MGAMHACCDVCIITWHCIIRISSYYSVYVGEPLCNIHDNKLFYFYYDESL